MQTDRLWLDRPDRIGYWWHVVGSCTKLAKVSQGTTLDDEPEYTASDIMEAERIVPDCPVLYEHIHTGQRFQLRPGAANGQWSMLTPEEEGKYT